MGDGDCTQSAVKPTGYWDYSDEIAGLVCGLSIWEDALNLYTKYQLWRWGHSAEFSLKSRTTGWDSRSGDFMVISISGTAKDSSVQCELEAGVQIMLCNSYFTNHTCNCQHNGVAGPLILLEQGAKLVNGTQAACGDWFIRASTT